MPPDAELAEVSLTVHPLALALADRRQPSTGFEAQVSLYHWAAAVLLRGASGIDVLDRAMIDAPDVAALRARVAARADAGLGRDEAIAEATLGDGRILRAHVRNARGSVARPLTDAELDEKFDDQARRVLPVADAGRLRDLLRGLPACEDVGKLLSPVLATARA
jgi:2-methylcitrate dehydratase PrpD